MTIMLRCPNCNSENVSLNIKQKRVKKSEVFHCWECGENTRFENMSYSYENNFDGTCNDDYTG